MKTMCPINHKDLSLGSFDNIHENSLNKNFILECIAHFHYRNGKIQSDNSLGEIKITPKQFKDILAYAIYSNPPTVKWNNFMKAKPEGNQE